jgi:hypothetical protein
VNARQQSSTAYPMTFFMADSLDGVSGKTGLTPTVTLSKNGGAFGAAAGAVSEIGSGWYALAGNATDRNTIGPLLLHATASGAQTFDGRFAIVGSDPFDANLALTRLDAAITSRAAIADYTTARAAKLDNLDATISSRSSHTAADVWAVGSRTLTAFSFAVDLSAAAVTAIWDKATSALTTAGSIGKRLADDVDAAISSRLATSGYTAPDNTSIGTILGRTDVATSTRLAAGSYTAPDNATIAAIAGYVDTEVAAIKAKTDNLPAAPAAVSDIPSAAAIAAAVWAAGTRTLTSFGTLAADVWAVATRTLTTSSGPTAAQISTQVWSEAIPGSFAAGSAGQKLNAAGSADDPLGNAVPGSYASGTAGRVLGSLGVISAAQVVTVSPVSADGSSVTIVRGDDYLAADARALDWTDAGNHWPDLTGATIAFTARRSPSVLTKAGSVVTPSGSSKSVRVELTAAETAALGTGPWNFDVQATLATTSHIVTLVLGTLTVLADQTHA